MFATKIENMTTSRQGNIGLVTAMQYFGSLGWIISIPLNDVQDYDLVVDNDEKLIKIQVKTTYHKANGKFKVKLRNTSKLFTENKSDYLFVVTSDLVKYLIPRDMVKATSGIVLGDNYSQFIVE